MDVNIEYPSFAAALSARRNAIICEWLDRTLDTYSRSTSRFLSQEKDRFRNPVGHAFQQGLPALFDGLAQQTDIADLAPVLDDIVRIRAVQDLVASQVVAFVFLLKQVIRRELKSDIMRYSEEITTLEGRIDEMAILAFDLYTKCRQQIHELRTKELKRMVSVMEQERWLVGEKSIG